MSAPQRLWRNECHRSRHQCHSQELSKVSGASFHLMSRGRTSCCTACNNDRPHSIWLWALCFRLFNYRTYVFFLAIPRLCYASSLSVLRYPYCSPYLSCAPYLSQRNVRAPKSPKMDGNNGYEPIPTGDMIPLTGREAIPASESCMHLPED